MNNNEQTMYYERYYLVETTEIMINDENITLIERKVIKAYKWWSIDELRRTSDVVLPMGFKDLIDVTIRDSKYPIDITDVTSILKL